MERQRHTDADADDDSIDVSQTKAYLAVGLLADAAGPDTYSGRDVAEAVDHLHAAREAAPTGTDTAERLDAALEYLEDVDARRPDSHRERHLCVRDALAELAPVAAGITDRDREIEGYRDTRPRDEHEDEQPESAVPVFYNVPPAVADRAIQRFERRREAADGAATTGAHLKDYIYDEIEEQSVIYVGGEPLADYAAGRVDELVIDPDAGRDDE